MNTEQHNFHRISYLIMLIALLSLGLTGQHSWFASLRSLIQPAATATSASRSLVVAAGGAPGLLLLNADALVATLNGGTVNLTARVRDTDGNPVPGVTVNFQSGQGSMAPASAATDANGVATATFTAGAVEGQAFVTATVNDLTREAAVQVLKPNSNRADHTLQLELSAAKLDPGQQMNLIAILRDEAGEPVAGEVISVFGSMGEVSPASAVSDANGHVSFTYHAGNVAGQAMITALAGYASQSANVPVGTIASPGQDQTLFLPLVAR